MEPISAIILIFVVSFIVSIIIGYKTQFDGEDPAPFFIFGGMLSFGISSIVSTLFLIIFTHLVVVETRTVSSIGGCDRYGSCSVKDNLGNKSVRSYPIINESFNITKIEWRY